MSRVLRTGLTGLPLTSNGHRLPSFFERPGGDHDALTHPGHCLWYLSLYLIPVPARCSWYLPLNLTSAPVLGSRKAE